MRIGYLDCFAGISGDMLLGALVGAGVPFSMLEEAAAAMNVGATLRRTTVDRSGISAVKIDVLEEGVPAEQAVDTGWQPRPQGHVHPHTAAQEQVEANAFPRMNLVRSLAEIKEMIAGSGLPEDVKEMATRTFELLGASEARVHNLEVEEIHFHEVGAVDAIVDIVACCAGLLSLQVDGWNCSAVNVGGGMVRCAHGTFPVPAPATADLLRGVPTYSAHVQKELVTPTGAALLRALNPEYGAQPAMRVSHVGYGAGSRNPEGFPNVLRLSLGETADEEPMQSPLEKNRQVRADTAPGEAVCVLETALDDATAQMLGYVTEQALAQGALDIMLTPVVMKKGRPGTLVTLLCEPADATRFEQFLLRETTTLGVRTRLERRVCLERAHVPVTTRYGVIRVKTGVLSGEVLNVTPEFEDCRTAALAHGVALKWVMQAATSAYLQREDQ